MASDRSIQIALYGKDQSLSSTLGKASGNADKTAGTFSALSTKIGKSFSGLGSLVGGELGEISNKAGEVFNALGEGSKSAGAKISAIGTVAAGLGGALTVLGSKDQAAQQQLQQAIENTGGSYSDYSDQIEETVKSQTKFGHTANDVDEALQNITQATNSPKIALQDMSVVSDLAAAKHENLATAALAVAKVYGGSAKVLKQFGISSTTVAVTQQQLSKDQNSVTVSANTLQTAHEKLTLLQDKYSKTSKLTAAQQETLSIAEQKVKAASDAHAAAVKKLSEQQTDFKNNTKNAQNAVDQLGQKLSGQASAASDTFTGKMHALTAEVQNNVATWGQKYGPALTAAGAGTTILGGIVQTGIIGKMGSGIASVGQFALKLVGMGSSAAAGAAETEVAAGAISTAEEGMAAASEEAGAASTVAFGPIGLALAAVGVAAYELYNHWTTVTHAIVTAFDFVKNGLVSGFNDIKGDLEKWGPVALAVLAPFIGIPILVVQHFGAIKTGIESVIHDVVGFFTALPGEVEGALSSAGNWLLGAGKKIVGGLVNGITGAAGTIFSFWTGLNSAILNAIGDAGSMLLDVGKDIVEGLVHGIEGAAGDVEKAIGGIASKAKKAITNPLGIFSPSRVFKGYGTNIVQGLANGVTESQHLALEAIAKTAEKTAQTAATHLNTTKAAVTDVGQTINSALGKAITGNSADDITDSVQKLTAQVSAVFTDANGKLEAKGKSLETVIANDNNALQGLAAQRSAVADQLSTAQDNLQTVLGQESSLQSSIAGAFSGGSLTSLFSQGAPGSSSDIISALQGQVQQSQQFAQDLQTLTSEGMDPNQVAQLAQEGAAQAGNIAHVLATGTAQQVQQVAALQGQLSATANSAGATLAKNVYGASVSAAQGIVDGLNAQQATLTAQMTALGNTLVATVLAGLAPAQSAAVKAAATTAATSTKAAAAAKAPVKKATTKKVAKAATGGIVQAQPGGQLVQVAEAGHDEALLPLPNGAKSLNDLLRGAGGGTMQHIEVNVPQTNASPYDIARELAWALKTSGT